MFEQKKTKHYEHFLACLYIQSPEVCKKHSRIIILFSNIYNFLGSAKPHSGVADCYIVKPNKTRRFPWTSCNVVTLLNNWQNYGNVVPGISIFLLRTSNLHAFVLAEQRVAYVLKKSMSSPLKMLTR